MESMLDEQFYPNFKVALENPLQQLPRMNPSAFTDQEVKVAKVIFLGIIFLGFEFYSRVMTPLVGLVVRSRIPVYVKPLEKLSVKDNIYIFLAKVATAYFVEHTYRFTVATEVSHISLDFSQESVLRALCWFPLHLFALIMIYDFFYTLFHWALHWPPIYPLIHKHHHRQMSPFRGNSDAINDAPLEYVSGEYLHLFAVFLLTRMLPPMHLHAISVILFIFIGGTLASLNHTRINFHIPYMFNVNSHDYHHRQPRVNFGQYIMFWDWVFGTYQAEGTLHADQKKKK